MHFEILSRWVTSDLIRTLFTPLFIKKLFKKQQMVTWVKYEITEENYLLRIRIIFFLWALKH